ncbi:HlyD family secretion protein [Bosea sp. BK604]|uniref:HlyD family secretion protein n=1 Tax=Bosea sp. BK604 TaxID=2512180 RepID=UPI00104B1A21|nr:HlyD family secretion protein [Bosea sp. BK604]TCR68732.1 membrane fusion protein (multidrug efflux system) [Bosea sp. BK604]
MSKHQDRITAERAVPPTEAVPEIVAEKLAEASAAVAEPPRPKHTLRRVALAGVAVAALMGAGYWGHDYWTVGRFQVSTDDAYVKADSTTIAPKISGYIAEVLVRDNEPVKAGQVLARIDDRDFRVALDQARADVAAARAAVVSKQAQLEAQHSVIDTAKATIEVDKANQTFAEQDSERYTNLAKTGYGSVQNQQSAQARIDAARAATMRDTAALAAAQKQVDLIKADLAQAQATVAHDEAVQKQAELNLSYASIVAPVDGTVGNRTLRVGQFVQAGTQLMAVVPLAATYIVANFKETQLTDVKPRQKVEVEVDMFPGAKVAGHVDSLAPASGQEFALLPPDNATGNFTKVVQRVPVKIVLEPDHNLAGALRPGMSVVPTINTKVSSQTTVADAR